MLLTFCFHAAKDIKYFVKNVFIIYFKRKKMITIGYNVNKQEKSNSREKIFLWSEVIYIFNKTYFIFFVNF